MNDADVLLVAGDDVIDTNPADSSLIMADDLTVEAANGTSDGPTAVNITTKVHALLLTVTGMNVGDVSINEVDAIDLRSVTTADGSITVVAGGTITATKVISLNPNSIDNSPVASAPHRDISLRANGIASDILVVQITAMNDADVLLVAGDDVYDTNPADSSLIMADDLTVEAANGTSDGPTAVNLTTKVNALLLAVTGINVGNVSINEVNAIELRSVTTADGSIEVVAGGTITATKVISLNPNSIDNSPVASAPHRDITLRAKGIASDIMVSQIIAMSVTDVVLLAGDDVIDTNPADLNRIVADDLKVDAANGTSGGTDAVNLTTNVNDLVLSVTGINVGDASINEVDSINLASSDTGGANDKLQTGNGKIAITAGADIVVNDNSAIDDTATLRGDVEIKAGGDRGQIKLVANQKIELGGATQLEATSATKESIVIDAKSVVLGSQIQLTTGNGTGIARWFSPRPAAGVPDTAFLDSMTVRKFPDNRLSGDGNSGGIGTFSVLIGQPGEAGFTINIDWGANTKRFEQYDKLLGDKTFMTTHVYTGKDILNSTLNGRPSATDPLQVRFAVRHHESILVTGNSIQQAAATAEQVPGRLISSTDNPTTALLESGTATFFIPNLTIPVAFFPVRQIIPEVVKPEIFVRVETSQFFASSTVESKTASASATVIREEYFQIRMLSLEPGGEALAPQRLPDDILTGDKLKQLFAELPDGKYEIQYVLGDGNERMLLRVDIRNQQPVVPGDELDGGKLELQPIDPESILQELQEAIDEKEIQRPPVDAQIQAIEIAPVVVVAPAALPVPVPDDESEYDQHAAYVLTGVVVASNIRKRSLRNVVANRPRRFSIAGRFVNRPR